MKQKTFFDQNTGKIITSVQGSIEFLDLSQYEEYDCIDVFGNPLTQYVENSELVNMPTKPSPESIFNFSTKQWENPSIEKGWEIVRTKRNTELSLSDWTQVQDVSLPNKQEWAEYRQALRDVTNQSDPFNIVWPTKPQG